MHEDIRAASKVRILARSVAGRGEAKMMRKMAKTQRRLSLRVQNTAESASNGASPERSFPLASSKRRRRELSPKRKTSVGCFLRQESFQNASEMDLRKSRPVTLFAEVKTFLSVAARWTYEKRRRHALKRSK